MKKLFTIAALLLCTDAAQAQRQFLAITNASTAFPTINVLTHGDYAPSYPPCLARCVTPPAFVPTGGVYYTVNATTAYTCYTPPAPFVWNAVVSIDLVQTVGGMPVATFSQPLCGLASGTYTGNFNGVSFNFNLNVSATTYTIQIL
ncbi:MAG: hypothetical protein JNL13_07745 [Chitinophagaceae bacterium]|nr:hypothetical protein [Chitinophagaceae bacterium]